MHKYELTIVLDGLSSPAKRKAIVEKITKLVKTNEGKVEKHQDWGRRDLSYKIKKSESGIFLHFPLELSAEAVKALPLKMKMETEIIRYLLVKA